MSDKLITWIGSTVSEVLEAFYGALRYGFKASQVKLALATTHDNHRINVKRKYTPNYHKNDYFRWRNVFEDTCRMGR